MPAAGRLIPLRARDAIMSAKLSAAVARNTSNASIIAELSSNIAPRLSIGSALRS